jgi:small subunit ribosomal protein SAe
MYWLLAREVLRMRGTISRSEQWNVMVDLFMHREPEEAEKLAAEQKERQTAEDANAQEDGYEANTETNQAGGQDVAQWSGNQDEWQNAPNQGNF